MISQPEEWTPNIYSTWFAVHVGPWMAGGLAVGVVILAVVIGWRMLGSVLDEPEVEEGDEEKGEEEGDVV